MYYMIHHIGIRAKRKSEFLQIARELLPMYHDEYFPCYYL